MRKKAGEVRRLLGEPLVMADEGMLLSLAGLAAVSAAETAVLVCGFSRVERRDGQRI